MKSKLANKLNLFALLTGAFVLAFVVTPMIPVHAQETAAPTQQQGPFAGVDLTSDQKSQIDQIQQAAHTKLDALLTSDQKLNWKMRDSKVKTHIKFLLLLNFTADQKAKAREIMESSRKQIDAILTPEQLQQVRQNHPHHPEAQQN